MVDSKLTALNDLATPVATDIVYAVANPGIAPLNQKLELGTLGRP